MAGGDLAAQGVIQLNNNNPRPRQPPGNIPPPPPPVPVAPLIHQNVPRQQPQIIQARPGLHSQQIHMTHPQQAAMYAPHQQPGRSGQFKPSGTVEVLDIRMERMTDAVAREALSEYRIFRIEKLADENDVDDEGKPVKPTWEKITRTEIRGLSKQEATRLVRNLDRDGKSAGEKKASLIPAQQRHVELAHEDLAQREQDPRFHYVLAQIEDQLKKIDYREVRNETYSLSRKPKETKQIIIGRWPPTVAKDKDKDKKSRPKYQRIALTVYFKRLPRPEQDALALYRLFERQKEVRMWPQGGIPHHQQQQQQQQQQHQFQHQQQHQPQPQHMQQMFPQMPMQQQQVPMMQAMPVQMPVQRQQVIPPPPPKELAGAKVQVLPQGVQVIPARGKAAYNDRRGHRNSSDSFYSESLSISDTDYTPSSSSASRSSRRGRRRSRSRSREWRRSRDRPEQYGIEAPRRHSREGYHFAASPRVSGPLVSPTLRSAPNALEIDFIKERAYQAGINDERAFTRALEARPIEIEGYRPRAALPPRIFQRQSSVRLVSPEELDRRRIEDDLGHFGRLRLEDERQEELRFEEAAEEELRHRRATERIRRQGPDDEFFPIEADHVWNERNAQEYMTRAERSSDPARLDNPFAFRGRETPYVARGYRH